MVVCDLFRVVTAGLIAIPGIPLAALCALLFCTVLAGAVAQVTGRHSPSAWLAWWA